MNAVRGCEADDLDMVSQAHELTESLVADHVRA